MRECTFASLSEAVGGVAICVQPPAPANRRGRPHGHAYGYLVLIRPYPAGYQVCWPARGARRDRTQTGAAAVLIGSHARRYRGPPLCWMALLLVGAGVASAVVWCGRHRRTGESVFRSAGHAGPVRVTVAAVDKDDPSWIVSHIAYGTVFADGETTGCVNWNGLGENGWPVPSGTYGLKGIVTQAKNWTGDGKYHTVAPQFEGAITPFNISLT
eukprot:SAG11_NODE_10529_length_824_cov_1.273103_1_plen_212_part_01